MLLLGLHWCSWDKASWKSKADRLHSSPQVTDGWERVKQSGVEELGSSQSGCTRQKVLVRQRGGLMRLLARWDMMMMMMMMKPWPGRPGIAIYFKFFIELATVTQHSHREWNKTCAPIHFPPSPFNSCTTPPGSMPPKLYKQQCGFFYVPQESEQWKSCETGPTVFHPYLRGLMSQPRQHILLRLFKTLSVDLAGVWTHDLPLSRPALIQ